MNNTFSLNNNLFREILSPLDQFEIRDLISLDAPLFANLHISITNIGLYLTVAGLFILVINLLSTNYNKLVSNNWSISQESLYATIHSIVTNQINGKSGQLFFPFIYTLFIVILVNNLVGMVQIQRFYGIINNNNLKLIGYRRINIANLKLGGLIMSNRRKVQSKIFVNLYSTTSSSNNRDSSSIVFNPNYLTGFIDAEGCFNVSILKNLEMATGWQIIPAFQLSLHTRDRALLEGIQRSFGVGSIYKHGNNSYYSRIFGLNNLSVLIKQLDTFPLLTQKQADYILFKQIVELMSRGEHLTTVGLLKNN